MDIPIAFPVADCKSPELYTLEQKQEALSVAERELETALALAEDFFETREEMDATLHTLRQHPDQPYSKPFMKKITAAILRVNACQQDVEKASKLVEDARLTPAQVKAQVKQMVEAQRVALEQMVEAKRVALEQMVEAQRVALEQLEQRMHAERVEWMSQIRQLREELDEERRHRKSFQSKVKDFSDYVYLVFAIKHLKAPEFIPQYKMPKTSYDTVIAITEKAPLYQHFSLDRRCSCGSNHFDITDTKCRKNKLAMLYRKYHDDGKDPLKVPMFTLPSFDEF
jgi:hypothetical protein